MTVFAAASPSLALVKYWGKAPGGVNLPATPSLAVTLDGLRTETRVSEATTDRVVVGGEEQPLDAYRPIIDLFRARAGVQTPVLVESRNSFPTAAGIASSSSGFAALAIALDAFHQLGLSRSELSAIARVGSGSAARAVWGGFTVWRSGAEAAEPFLPAGHWPQLRLLVAIISAGRKPIASRAGMRATAETSPIYRAWCDESPAYFESAARALEVRDLDALGEAMRASYLFMFSTMFTTRPPFIYWLPESIAVIHAAERLRSAGVPVWETMDAGPQVKLLTTDQHVDAVRSALAEIVPHASILESRPGGEPEVRRG